MATFNAVLPRVSLAPLRLHPRTVHARPAERGRGPACATVRHRDRPARVDVLRVEAVGCACVENGSSRCNSLPVVNVCSRAEHVVEWSCGHHAIAGCPAEPQVRSSPLARRDGAKRSGLTAARTAEQSHVVMAAPVRPRSSARERTRRTGRAGLESSRQVTDLTLLSANLVLRPTTPPFSALTMMFSFRARQAEHGVSFRPRRRPEKSEFRWLPVQTRTPPFGRLNV
jgi:hypothetical protein